MTGHTGTVRSVNFLGAQAAVSASRDATLRTWDLATGASTATLAGHDKSVASLALRGDVAVSGSDDGLVRIWSLSGQSCLAACPGHTAEVRAVAIADDGSRIFSGSRDGHVRVWDPTGACIAVLQGHSSLVSHVRVHRDFLVTAGADGQIRVWSAKSLLLKYAVHATEASITSLDIFENRVLSGQSDGLVRLWDFETGAALGCVGSKSEAVWHTESSNGRSTIVVAAREDDASTLSLWQL
ncbi:hypothetical protein MPH_08482 [Macrophomina phaseolina MS6]|uniref:Mitochondrial division protein 1 n=1 Tax=Macrophomina phaseolina (strain MS6) TaxID=1126212 RepID=K2RNB0_MACPH|nr:hypothetical protein MPH_08482 [Macrophomina phaseolina MS6]